jgi:hypothetical protein
METKKQAKFRLIVKDIESNKVLVNTIYEDSDNKNLKLEDFVKLLMKKIEAM